MSVLTLTILLAAAPQGPCDPLSLQFDPVTVGAGEMAAVVAQGVPGTFAFLGIDFDPGPTFVPPVGQVALGFTSGMALFGITIPPSGLYRHAYRMSCKTFTYDMHAQAASVGSGGSLCLSNPARMHFVPLPSFCGTPPCLLPDEIGAGFNGTAIPAGRFIWFNAVVKVRNMPSTGGWVAYRNARIDFHDGVTQHVLPVANARIHFSPVAVLAHTYHEPAGNSFETAVPAGYDQNVFLSGCSMPVGTALPGGIGPVTWRGEFYTDVPGVEFQWKWAAAVYTSFSTDLNALCIKPVDGSSLSIYNNSHHAGTPECFTGGFTVGGARGGGSSNFTGSYSGTRTVRCP